MGPNENCGQINKTPWADLGPQAPRVSVASGGARRGAGHTNHVAGNPRNIEISGACATEPGTLRLLQFETEN